MRLNKKPPQYNNFPATATTNHHLMQKLILSTFAAALLALSGCATITSGTSQSVTIDTIKPDGSSIAGVACTINNGKGSWVVTTPGSITINKAYGDAVAKCEKSGDPATEARVQSKTKAHTAGNLILGGVIGLGIDAMSGATWAYPDVWKIILGRSPQILDGNGLQLEGEALSKALPERKSETETEAKK